MPRSCRLAEPNAAPDPAHPGVFCDAGLTERAWQVTLGARQWRASGWTSRQWSRSTCGNSQPRWRGASRGSIRPVPPECDGFIDVNEIPPWGTWIAWAGEMLLSWVPASMVAGVGSAIRCNPEESIRWASEQPEPLIQELRGLGVLR